MLCQCVIFYACCGIKVSHAEEFGTHSNRIAAIEILRRRGVPRELRQQLGDWMSKSTALRYMQLTPGAKFDILDSI